MGVEKNKKEDFIRIHGVSSREGSFTEEHSLIGGPGFSRVVWCNHPSCFDETSENCGSNYVRTTKYTPATFFPKALFEQFRRAANVYFLLCAVLCFTPFSPISAVANFPPFVIVVGISMAKELLEDLKRKKQDNEVNNRRVKVLTDQGFEYKMWMDIGVGDIVKVEKDEFFPADIILLSSSFEQAHCYVETTNLDGETNLKLKEAVEATSKLSEDSMFKRFRAIIRCEDPNANLYAFVGSMEIKGQHHSLTLHQLLLRDSKLKNTDFVYGVVIFVGEDTKVLQNSVPSPSKRSKIEKRVDELVFLLFSLLVSLSIFGSIVFGLATKEDLEDGRITRWYLRPDNTAMSYDPKRATIATLVHLLTALLLYSYLIPISLYVSVEIVKVLQSMFINSDLLMYYEERDKPARARTSNLNEELGHVETILSDKTGTLTCNSMEFVKCSIAGKAYGRGAIEVDSTLCQKTSSPLSQNKSNKRAILQDPQNAQSHIKGFNFVDERIMEGNWVKEPHLEVIQKFFQLLAICHTAVANVDEETGRISYESESPDEAAFVVAAKEIGFQFYARSRETISVKELDLITGRMVVRVYDLLNVIEFSSSRKRMSVIVRNDENNILLLCKGADSVILHRLASSGREFEKQTREHIDEYATAGLRTMILAYRQLSEKEYATFNEDFTQARNFVFAHQEKALEAVADSVEKDLILLGATAVEDKLQDGVHECIDKLSQAGVKIWILTGDKLETATNISFSCGLLRRGMKHLIINSETPELEALWNSGDDSAAIQAGGVQALKECIMHHINKGNEHLKELNKKSEALSLTIDGKALTHALEDDVKEEFLQLALCCASVVCCRSSPKQKALITRLVKSKTGKTTLAIGDGANDVGMLQEADIGIGISGSEGMQAVMASDFAIAQFRFLERLLLVHGHWCYRRISSMICYFFYKNIVFGFTLFFFEACTSFSGQAAYNDWYLSLYNVLFTSLPAIALGVFDQDIPAQFCLKFPIVYREGIQNILFSWSRILGWLLNGVFSATCICLICTTALENQAFRRGGEVVGLEILGTTMYTCVVLVVNFQMALSINYFTYIQHLLVWGGTAFWFMFVLLYGSMDPYLSTTAFMVFMEACAPSISFWLVLLFMLASTLLPYFTYSAIQMHFFPMYHQVIQLSWASGQSDEPE